MWLGFRLLHVVRENRALANDRLRLPDLWLLGVDGLNFRLKPGLQPIVIVIFDSTCESCRTEVLALHEYKHLLGQIQLLLVSSEPITAIRKFARKSKLTGYRNIRFASLEPGRLQETFGPGALPHILVYEQDGRLIAQLRGATSPQHILGYLRKRRIQ
jgi:hypothetical protein